MKLFQSLFVIILKPVLQSLLKAPLKLIAAVLQLLTTDIRRLQGVICAFFLAPQL